MTYWYFVSVDLFFSLLANNFSGTRFPGSSYTSLPQPWNHPFFQGDLVGKGFVVLKSIFQFSGEIFYHFIHFLEFFYHYFKVPVIISNQITGLLLLIFFFPSFLCIWLFPVKLLTIFVCLFTCFFSAGPWVWKFLELCWSVWQL